MAIDAHCHLNDEAFNNDYLDIVGRLSSDNIDYAIVTGYNLESSLNAIEIAKKSNRLYAALGYQPENIDEIKDGDFIKIEELLNDEKVVAVGEIGLDYHWPPFDKLRQIEIFEYQIEMANRAKLPIIIHQRDCGMDVLNILKKKKCENGIMLHCFSESLELCKEFVKLGCYISLGGTLTFKNAGKLLDVCKYVPKELLLSETDSPYLTPVPFRGKRNEPKYVNYVVDKMAELRGVEREEIEKQIENNFKTLFKKVQ